MPAFIDELRFRVPFVPDPFDPKAEPRDICFTELRLRNEALLNPPQAFNRNFHVVNNRLLHNPGRKLNFYHRLA